MLLIIIVSVILILFVPMLIAGKDKDFNKFMGNFRN